MIYLIELQAHDGDAVRSIYLSMDGYTSKPGDTPSNQYYTDRVRDAGLFEQHLFSAGKTSGPSEVGYGDIVVHNNKPYGYDELIDEWVTWNFVGYTITIKKVDDETAPLSSAETVFVGVCDQLVSTDALNEFSLKIRDRLIDLDLPLLTGRYLGTTTAEGVTPGAEGNEDVKDRIKPVIFGSCEAVECVTVNAYELIYQVSASAVSSITVYDGGFAMDSAGDVASLTALRSWVQVAGQVKTCKALGLFRLGHQPTAMLSADVVEGATAADRTAAQIARRMLLYFGIAADQIVTASFTVLDVLNSAVCGIRIDDETAALDAMQETLGSVGAAIGANALGQFTVGRLSAPAVSAAASFELDDDLNDSPTRTAPSDDGDGAPYYRVKVNYRKVWQVHSGSDVVGAVTPARKTFLGTEYRTVMVEDLSILEQFPNAPELEIDTLLTASSDALAEATRLLALHSVQRSIYVLLRPLDQAEDLELNSTVEIISVDERLELGAGANFVLLGKVTAYGDADTMPTAELHCWG